ncbi:TPA: hypothetical protein TZ822_001766 [Streptococcus suis]|nr:hypothetical protein [Streptococcus suis]HEL2635703.1 hypothetical protein [Streptococcus suis]HEM2592588.1 hypothetical protein [Streptococcus suis]
MTTAQTYFYVFDQNNSGGYFVIDENVTSETKLCDFIIGQTGITFYRSYSLFKNQQPRFLTCDKPLCDNCSNRFHGMDLCKNHFKKITGGIK